MANHLPDIGAVLAPLLARVSEGDRPLLVAMAERLAAERYRVWARDPAAAGHEKRLLACADREEEIAGRIESLYPDAAARRQAIRTAIPELDEINRTLFAGRPVAEQLAIQASGERLGAATWRSLARAASDPHQGETFLGCAPLEEASAEVLESILAARDS
jgi:hypothetical protein